MFREQLVQTLGPVDAETLLSYAHDEALKIISLSRKHFSIQHSKWMNNEGGFPGLVTNLCCHALAAPSWEEGFKEYWRILKKEYRYDNQYQLVSLDALVELYGEYEYAWEAGGASSPLAPSEGVALSDYAPLPNVGARWVKWFTRKPDDFQDILWTWLQTRSHESVAELLNIPVERSRAVYRDAKKYAYRLVTGDWKSGPKVTA